MTITAHESDACEIITDSGRFAEIINFITAEKEIALDLEMDSLHHYREKVCLLQISTRTNSWLIDPLAVRDLSLLAGPLGDPGSIIVMHGADYDIRSLHRDFGIEINNLFDTMLASRFLGIQEFGLAALLKSRFGIELNKKYQKADWSKRPLSAEMCAYATADTADLLALYDQLRAELVAKGRLHWLEEECALLCQARVTEKEGPLFLSCKGAGKLRPRNLAILEGLLQMREQYSKEMDRPPFKVISGETLLEASEKKPRSMHDLTLVKGMTPGQIHKYGETIISVVSAALSIPEEKLPRIPRRKREEPTEGTKHRIQRLKLWRDQLSSRLELEPGVLAPNWLLEAVADANPGEPEELSCIPGMREWQKKLYGHELTAELALA